MIGLRTLARTAVVAVTVVAIGIGLVACSDSSSGDGAGTASSDSTATERSDSVAATDGTVVDESSVSATTSSVASTTTSRPATTVATTSTAPPPETSDPFASAPEPDDTEPDDFVGPAADDCVDAAAGAPTAEIVLDDDRILFGGTAAPSCLRVHIGQRIAVRNSGSVRAEVLVGSEILTVEPGASASTEVLSTRYAVADVFDVYVETIDATLIVQVIPSSR
ncbi:MAG: hypothetical protein Q8M22_07050 [Actinomycetota bacterium]|nr:hypothetical protein [Actinomycetota bacterium]